MTTWKRPFRECRVSRIIFWGSMVFLYLFPLFYFPINNPNERVRIYMTAAMVDHGTFAIGYRERIGTSKKFKDKGSVYDKWGYVNDKALICPENQEASPNCAGTLYSAKAPGMSFLGVPFYAGLRLMGFDPSLKTIAFYLRFWTVILPSLLFLVFFRRYAATWVKDPWLLDLATTGLGLGSMVYTYSHMYAGHQVTAYMLFASLALAELASRESSSLFRTPWALALSGFFAAFTVITEYPTVGGAFVVFMLLVLRRVTWKSLGWFLAGTIIPGLLMAWFHTVAFGAPWHTAYSTLENPQFVKDIDYGFMGLRAPALENIWGSFIAPFNGMFFFAPWLALILPAAWTLMRPGNASNQAPKGLRIALLAQVGVFTLFISCHSLWRGGWTLGPRYIVPFVPFAALGIILAAELWSARARTPVRFGLLGLVIISVLVTGSCSLVSQGFHTAFFNPLAEVTIPLLTQGYMTTTLGHYLGLESFTNLLLIGLALAALVLPLLLGMLPDRPALVRTLAALGVMGFVSSGLWGLTQPRAEQSLKSVEAIEWTRDHFDPLTLPPVQKQRNLEKDLHKTLGNTPEVLLLKVNHLTRAGDGDKALKTLKRMVDKIEAQKDELETTSRAASMLSLENAGSVLPVSIPGETIRAGKPAPEVPADQP